jgi:hypothetical protein
MLNKYPTLASGVRLKMSAHVLSVGSEGVIRVMHEREVAALVSQRCIFRVAYAVQRLVLR